MTFDKLAVFIAIFITAAGSFQTFSRSQLFVCLPLVLLGLVSSSEPSDTIAAAHLDRPLDSAGFPTADAWKNATPVSFNADWQGKNSDPQRATEVRMIWTSETLFLHYKSTYRNITVFPDAEPSGRRDHLWDCDVVEVFLQPDPAYPTHYFEFEVSPNNYWIDLDIAAGHGSDLKSGMKSRTVLNEKEKIWTAEISIPIRSMTPSFNPSAVWRLNFFRVEGPEEPRFYSSWQPTNSPKPNFHVPAAFGKLTFR